ncbi:superoxide dismutase [Cu-Zn] SodC [Undibacterium sp. TC4M20W]|jgi:Cu-Zn family superoxide dismutase|uniref:superoxide dismutase family protein n=1 Tax=unclassified Undibacterium TaxID=2630295 RepID=UPI001331E8F6|nr:superoxide dismutase family protein [Undibacterium sp. YM2]BBB65941.1 superoxide dismutase [Cu-Zn] [Undibacterium sp. YM2]
MKTKLIFCLLSALPLIAAADVTVNMNQVSEAGVGTKLGQVVVSESKYGLVFTPALTGLTPGLHGFHVHQNADCSAKEKDGKLVAALGAGGHYDPENSNRHGTPWGDGHAGDLPPLYVDASGNANQPVLAPRLKLADLKGRSLMIHIGGDNHSDHPAVLGGGGARVVCGVS